jgi:hypothetical protein
VRSALIALVLVTLWAAPLDAAERCNAAYRAFMHRLNERAHALPITRLVALHRQAVRIFDACETGDLPDPEALFRRLGES